ncbi:MAG: ATP-dependent helicase [Propionibacteriaceae bacterium]|jgi:DNA helicase-2/ATP-dependent DNA helicase PcrA|nr:ATP-dependent helicase [Propionibacteriaceae bacterium]
MSKADDLLAELDESQRQVATAAAPVAVLAGAGSGKTRAITYRIAYQVAIGGYRPESVLAVTFTSRAAQELRQRLAMLGVHATARTFHSAALRQISFFWPKAYGFELPKVLPDRSGLLTEVLIDLQLPANEVALRELSTEISWAKTSNITFSDYAELASGAHRSSAELEPQDIARALGRYEYAKSAQGWIDFDDVLLCCCAMLDENPGIAYQVRDTYQHLVVDEYQDVSGLQQSLLRLWTGEGQDLCVVGDPAQTIHSFAGATPKYLLGFGSEHPDAEIVKLDWDYRSTPQIVALANHVAGFNAMPPAPLRSVQPDGPAPLLIAHSSDEDEALGIADWLRERRRSQFTWDEMAVLYRVHAQGELLRRVLQDAGIPVWVRQSEETGQLPSDRVTLTTLHAAKGLEWQAVAMAGVQEGSLPFALAVTGSQLAEEARLCYVGVTRAKRELRVSWVRQPSRFLPLPVR